MVAGWVLGGKGLDEERQRGWSVLHIVDAGEDVHFLVLLRGSPCVFHARAPRLRRNLQQPDRRAACSAGLAYYVLHFLNKERTRKTEVLSVVWFSVVWFPDRKQLLRRWAR